MQKKHNDKKLKNTKRNWYILGFVFSVFILGTAIAKKFQLSPIEWISLAFWFGGLGIYKYSSRGR